MKQLARIFFDGEFHIISIDKIYNGYSINIKEDKENGYTSCISSDSEALKSPLEVIAHNICENYVKTAWMIGL